MEYSPTQRLLWSFSTVGFVSAGRQKLNASTRHIEELLGVVPRLEAAGSETGGCAGSEAHIRTQSLSQDVVPVFPTRTIDTM